MFAQRRGLARVGNRQLRAIWATCQSSTFGRYPMNWIKSLTFMLFGVLPLLASADDQEIPPLAETGSAHYRFERLNIDSPDHQRHYRLDIGIPRSAPPATGYPVMYLLDGNNVMAELKEDWLGELNAGAPPLLVMIGYDIDGTYDGEQRTRDYTGDTNPERFSS